MARRLAPAMATCDSVASRQVDFSERVGRASRLLSTRVDIVREKQNQALLASMNRRARLQLRLQQTVEGLSIAAITYYGVGLVGYLAKGAEGRGGLSSMRNSRRALRCRSSRCSRRWDCGSRGAAHRRARTRPPVATAGRVQRGLRRHQDLAVGLGDHGAFLVEALALHHHDAALRAWAWAAVRSRSRSCAACRRDAPAP